MSKRFFLLLFVLLLLLPTGIKAITQDEQEALWRAELAQTEADIAKWQSILDSTKANTASLQQEAAVLNAKIKQAQAFIKQRNVQIAKLDVSIKEKTKTITSLEAQIEKGRESLAQLLRKTNEIDQFSLTEVMLSDEDLSSFFSDIDSFQTIKKALADLFVQIRDTKDLTEKEKASLAKQQDQQLDQKAAMALEQKKVQADEKQKQYLITINKTQEKTYAQVLAERQAKAAEIKAKLFKLAGGSVAIPFGTALTYAQNASNKTNVSPAFLLAILTQESNLGANVGKCYLTDATTGAGVGVESGKTFSNLMKPTRDVQPFLEITNRLGYNAYKTVVSCPIAGVAGYGGAMGPAQFIPSTWKIFEERLKDTLGHDANPWDAQDAFMASAMYLGDLGAKAGTYSSELRAACKYYGSGGSTCSYGRSVMGLKASIQSDIDYMLQYGVSRR
ncbi:MAG: lytic murein transglycosylase [Candidatus Paceibacterota bacterium]|jgi:membrane-bound lytic murein transglycosylase B